MSWLNFVITYFVTNAITGLIALLIFLNIISKPKKRSTLKRFFLYIKKWEGQHYLYLFTAIIVSGISFAALSELLFIPPLLACILVTGAIAAINSELD